MARLTLVSNARSNSAVPAHRASATEGEAARKLLEANGFTVRGPKNKQYELCCPFHEGPGAIPRGKSPNFYMNSESSQYYCFAGETRVLTPLGVREIRDLVGPQRLLTASPEPNQRNRTAIRRGRWVDAEVRSFGVQRLMRVALTRNGASKSLDATAEHRWFRWSQGKCGYVEVTTDELKSGDRLMSAFPQTTTAIPSSIGVAHGVTYGDGTRRGAGSSVDLWGDKNQKLLRFFPEPHTRSFTKNDLTCTTVFGLPAFFKQRPAMTESPNYLLGWLSGYFAADGTVSSSGQVSLQSARRDDLEFVRDVCTSLGIGTYSIGSYSRVGIDGRPGAMYHLTLMGSCLSPEFFQIDEHRDRFVLSQGHQEHATWTVSSVTLTDREEEVFCAVVPKTHAFVLEDNILTGNCQSAACGERGNLKSLEQFFGVDADDDFAVAYRDRESRLQEYELNLTPELRRPFYEHGLTDQTIERFRFGYWPEHTEDRTGREVTIPGRYVIPYLQGRRPKFFRFYAPYGDPKYKYTWEDGAEASLFNASDAMGDKDGLVFICEGELKAAMLVQMGYCAVAVPGAAQWRDEWQAAFTHARRIVVCYDNDNPEFHNYDKVLEDGTINKCRKCEKKGLSACEGHNPGQEQAVLRVDQIGWRAKNVVLPLTDVSHRKTDINDYFIRDGNSNADFAELVTGKRSTPFKVQSLAEISAAPPQEVEFLIDEGILSKGGRLLVAGRPKIGKSIFVNNLALSLASGLPFLKAGNSPGFKIDHPTRTLLLDRELSKSSLYKRLQAFTEAKPALKAAHENLLIDHDHLIRLDQPSAYDTLMQLVEQNGAEVCILDTAYKFFGGDVESSSSLMKGFAVLDKVIHETGCAFVMTHHLRKGSPGKSATSNTDVADPEAVVGSFLWTGWPNATILLNFLNRSVENPFNAVATFTAFRDAAPPEPLTLYRDRESISYTAIEPYSHSDSSPDSPGHRPVVTKPTTEAVSNLLLEICPTTEEDFLHMAAGHFGVSIPTVRPYFIDAMSSGNFERTSGKPPIIKFKHDAEPEQTWEQEHHLPERSLPDNVGLSLDIDMFEAADLL